MKNTVLKYGLLSGLIISVLMSIHLALHDRIGMEMGMVVGYATMLLAFLLVYFGVRSYRDEVAGGSVGFGRAFVVGMLIALISSLCYVATWEVIYFKFHPDFIEKYQAHMLEQERAAGADAATLARKRAEGEEFARKYRNPAFNAAVTLAEPLPVALVVALVTAGVVSRGRRRRDEPEETFAGPAVAT